MKYWTITVEQVTSLLLQSSLTTKSVDNIWIYWIKSNWNKLIFDYLKRWWQFSNSQIEFSLKLPFAAKRAPGRYFSDRALESWIEKYYVVLVYFYGMILTAEYKRHTHTTHYLSDSENESLTKRRKPSSQHPWKILFESWIPHQDRQKLIFASYFLKFIIQK